MKTDRNALFSLAYIKAETDLLYALSQLLYFAIKRLDAREYTLTTIMEETKKFSELEFPIAIIKLCLRKLKNEKYINYNGKNKTFCLSDKKILDDSLFLAKANEYKHAEDYVFQEFRIFLSGIDGANFTNDEIRNGIAKFLISGDNAVSVFLDGRISNSRDKQGGINVSWYFAYFIEKSLGDSKLLEYLHDLSYGYAVCVSLFGTPDDSDIIPDIKIANTEFFFDTKLALRFLGYSYSSEVKSARELVTYIKNANGRVCIFPRNIAEVGNALHNAAIACKMQNFASMDQEICFYASDQENAEKLIEMFGNGLRIDSLEDLFRSKGFSIGSSTDPHWADALWDQYNINVDGLNAYIQSCHPGWKAEVIDNDVTAINYINRFRKGNYSNYFGGKRKSAVFVTTNYSLIYDIKSYQTIDATVSWRDMRLPIISDLLLTYSLWLKMGKAGLGIQNAISSKVLYSLHHQCENFKSKVLEKARQLEQSSKDELPFIYENAHWDTLHHILCSTFVATNGDPANLTNEILINSEQEAIRLHSMEVEKEKSCLANENSVLRAANEAAKAREISLWAKIFEFNISELHFYILAYNYGYCFLILVYVLCLFISNIFSLFINCPFCAIGISILLSIVFLFFGVYDLISKKRVIKKYFQKIMDKKVENHIANIIPRLSKETVNYKDIVDYIKCEAKNQINSKLK